MAPLPAEPVGPQAPLVAAPRVEQEIGSDRSLWVLNVEVTTIDKQKALQHIDSFDYDFRLNSGFRVWCFRVRQHRLSQEPGGMRRGTLSGARDAAPLHRGCGSSLNEATREVGLIWLFGSSKMCLFTYHLIIHCLIYQLIDLPILLSIYVSVCLPVCLSV